MGQYYEMNSKENGYYTNWITPTKFHRNTTTTSYGAADRPVYELSFSVLVLIVNCMIQIFESNADVA